MSDESDKPHVGLSLGPGLNYIDNAKIPVKLVKVKITFNQKALINLYIAYKIKIKIIKIKIQILISMALHLIHMELFHCQMAMQGV